MALENRRDTTINSRLYSILLPPVTQRLPLCNRTAVLLAPIISDGLGAATDKLSLNGPVAEKLKAIIGPALIALTGALSKVDPLKADGLMMDAMAAAHLCCEGQPVSATTNFERHFSQYPEDVYQVLTWALWECVAPFFPKLEGSPLQAMAATAKAAFRSRTAGASTGGSVDPAGTGSADGQTSQMEPLT